jgi:hypothetical protein
MRTYPIGAEKRASTGTVGSQRLVSSLFKSFTRICLVTEREKENEKEKEKEKERKRKRKRERKKRMINDKKVKKRNDGTFTWFALVRTANLFRPTNKP